MFVNKIIEMVLKEARIDKLALLQEQQINNMLGQFFAKNKIEKNERSAYLECAKQLNEIIKKLKVDFKNEKLLLLWLLEQVRSSLIPANQIKEDSAVITDNLDLYFKNRGEIKKNIYDSTYSDVKMWIKPFKKGGEEAEHKEFLSKPVAEGKGYKIYKVTSKDECIKIGKGTSWCIQGEKWALNYLAKGPLWLVTKNDKRFALIQFESGSFMDVDDKRLKQEVGAEIMSIWPEAMKLLLEPEIIKNIQYIQLNEEEQLGFVNEKNEYIEYILNPTLKVQELAIKNDPKSLLKIHNPALSVVIEAVKESPEIIADLKSPSEKVQLAAVNENGKVIKYIDNPSVKVQMAAVENKWIALHYIKHPDKSVIKRAIEKDPRAAEFA